MSYKKKIIPIVLILLGAFAFSGLMFNRSFMTRAKNEMRRAEVIIMSERFGTNRMTHSPAPEPRRVMVDRTEKEVSGILSYLKEIISLMTSLAGLILLVKQIRTGKKT